MHYAHIAADNRLHDLKEKAARELGQVIRGRGWTQTRAAQFLSVSQPRISNLLSGHIEKFTLDMLITMLISLDRPVELAFPDPTQWRRSPNWSPDPQHADSLNKVEHYSELIRQDPTNSLAHSRRADAYHRLGQDEQAIADYTRAFELDPSRPGALFNRASLYRHTKQYKAALLDYKTLLNRFPDCNIHQNRSLLYFEMQDYESALYDMDKAIEIEPERPGPWTNRAMLYRKLNQPAKARADYEKALEIDPTSWQIRQALEELEST
ncbi:MAG: tetratricopeptide repeat protein [Candidatus Eremiobacteraeota bacterium]|nr:tetratricopeptide repeat protein [Candidatus Eremiobacteraeota bacterium]MCW5869358.1 tetratricopeptide repeat protein [Candidatus Eremiobacteraeota bacterium]